MRFQHKVFATQFPIAKRFIYHLIYYRALLTGYQEHQLRDEFWTLTIDAHLLRALTNWCMVVGSESEPTHWKRLSTTDTNALYNSFRRGLFEATDLTQDTWQKYWESWSIFVTNTPYIVSWILAAQFRLLKWRSRSHTITILG